MTEFFFFYMDNTNKSLDNLAKCLSSLDRTMTSLTRELSNHGRKMDLLNEGIGKIVDKMSTVIQVMQSNT